MAEFEEAMAASSTSQLQGVVFDLKSGFGYNDKTAGQFLDFQNGMHPLSIDGHETTPDDDQICLPNHDVTASYGFNFDVVNKDGHMDWQAPMNPGAVKDQHIAHQDIFMSSDSEPGLDMLFPSSQDAMGMFSTGVPYETAQPTFETSFQNRLSNFSINNDRTTMMLSSLFTTDQSSFQATSLPVPDESNHAPHNDVEVPAGHTSNISSPMGGSFSTLLPFLPQKSSFESSALIEPGKAKRQPLTAVRISKSSIPRKTKSDRMMERAAGNGYRCFQLSAKGNSAPKQNSRKGKPRGQHERIARERGACVRCRELKKAVSQPLLRAECTTFSRCTDKPSHSAVQALKMMPMALARDA